MSHNHSITEEEQLHGFLSGVPDTEDLEHFMHHLNRGEFVSIDTVIFSTKDWAWSYMVGIFDTFARCLMFCAVLFTVVQLEIDSQRAYGSSQQRFINSRQ